MRLQPTILCERNGLLTQSERPVTYSQEQSDCYVAELQRMRFTLFHYEWFHRPSGKRGISKLWTLAASAALALIGFWNNCSDDWTYRLVEKRT